MPALTSRSAAVAVDMAGCPNRCRHCWLGNPPNQRVPEDTLRWVVRQFRDWRRPGEQEPTFQRLSVATWYREPDFASHYRRLWELEQELSDETPGLHAMFHVPVSDLAARYGRPESRLLYDRDDLVLRWLHLWANRSSGPL